jgi:hypothetical protein
MYIFYFLIAAMLSSLYSCKEESLAPKTDPERNTISGTVTFVDTNLIISSDGAYQIAAFEQWPPKGRPAAFDSLRITKIGKEYKANYKLAGLGVYLDAYYVIAVGWVKRPYGSRSPVLGIYSCDTARYSSCIYIQQGVWIKDNKGVANINFLCWADTTKQIAFP